MGIPTGPQQGKAPSGGGLPTGRASGNQQPAQPRQRPAGLPQPQQPPRTDGGQQQGTSQRRPVQQRPTGGSSGAPTQRPQQPAQQPTQQPAQRPTQRPPAQAPRQAPQPAQQLPSVPEEQFDDPFNFDSQDADPFSDLPAGYTDAFPDDSLGFEDDPFEPVGEGQTGRYDDGGDEDEFSEPAPIAPTQPPAKKAAARTRRLQGNNGAPERGRAADEEYEDSFVDKENLKLKPFGKQKKRAKVGDFDARKNMEGQRKVYRGVFIAAVLAIVGFGAYQTFWPQESISVAEVEEIASVAVGDTGFPTTRGEGFALSFTDSLLNLEPGPDALAKRTAALSYFYGTVGDTKSFDSALTAVGNISQQVVYGPVVLESTPITAKAASYEIGVLLNTADADAPKVEGSVGAENIAESLRWVAFNVNVYYDETKNSFAIAPNSPTLLPAPTVDSPSVVPAGEPLGTAVDDVPESVQATIVGFLSGYRESTKNDFSKILQYIGTEADESLRDGLGSRYQFATPDDPASSIDTEVFQTGDDLSELKIELTVDWQIPTGESSSVTFPSHYVLTLASKGGGDYTVTKFAPYYWVEPSDPAE